MKHLYLVESEEELYRYQHFVAEIQPRLDLYISYLQQHFAVKELPRAILWTNADTATKQISAIPIPAYTNEWRTVITPDLEAWQTIYLQQLEGLPESSTVRIIKSYYETALNRNHILQILGHELAHHSELFLEDFQSGLSEGIWFEEGMAEYISRRFFLPAEEFDAEVRINQALVDLFAHRYADHSLEDFGASTYAGDYASIFFEYWRSFLAVKAIMDAHRGDIHAVFRSYHEWSRKSGGQSLTQWFGIEK